MSSKICTRCHTEKELIHFYKQESRKNVSSWCKSCSTENAKSWYSRNRERARETGKTYRRSNRSRIMMQQARKRAKEKKIVFNLTETDLPQRTECPVLGVPFEMNGHHPFMPSIDRIVPDEGYTKGNVDVISFRANTIKSDGTAEEHRRVAEYIEQHLKSKRQADYSELEP